LTSLERVDVLRGRTDIVQIFAKIARSLKQAHRTLCLGVLPEKRNDNVESSTEHLRRRGC
jgi:hypothetical protein